MRNKVMSFVLLMLVALVLLGLRGFWYYPANKRSPVLESKIVEPSSIDRLLLKAAGETKMRFYLVENDKALAFPEGNNITWSHWAGEHEVKWSSEPGWRKIFIEEKWLIYRKRSSQLFFTTGAKHELYRKFYDSRYSVAAPAIHGEKRILFIGDSLTVGLFAQNETFGFTALVEKAAGKNAIVNRLGVIKIKSSGMNLQEIIRRVNRDTDVVVVELGTNDFESTPLTEFRTNYHQLLKAFRKANLKVNLICLGTWDGYRAYQYDQVIMEEAQVANGRFVYLGDLFEIDENKSIKGKQTPWGPADDFHPSDRGHRAIADRVIAAIEAE